MVRSFRSVGSAVAIMAVAVLAVASDARAQEAAQPAAQQPPAMTLESGAGMFFHMIKSDRTSDFEWLMNKIKEAFTKSEDAQRKQMAAGIRVLKSTDAVPNSTNVMYVVLINPAVPGADYSMQNMMKIVYEAFPAEQQDIYKRLQGAFGGPTNRVNLAPIADFGK